MQPNPVKQALRAGKPSVGTWLSLGNITAARFLARAGFAWLTVDIEHSLVGIETATHMFGFIADAGCIALARVPSNRHDHIKRVLDNGRKHKVAPGIHCGSDDEAKVRIDEGWQFVAVASELRMMLDGVNSAVQKLGLKTAGEMAKY